MNNKPRKAWIAGILTFLTVGLGHIYTGRPKRGLILFFCQGVLPIIILIPLLLDAPSLLSLIMMVIIGFAFFIFCLVDAIKIARNNQVEYQPKKYNKWYIYLICWIVAVLIIQPLAGEAIKKNIIQSYKITSGGMIPTVLIGDRVIVSKMAYKNSEPQRGDIIICPSPSDPSQDFIERLIGLEGDMIEIKNKQLYINDKKYLENYIVYSDPTIRPAETSPRDNFGPIIIPEGKLFVMGDDRDNSYDSRFWKFVEKKEVKGKVEYMYWSWDSKLSKVRWSRIGKSIDQLTN